MADVTVACLIEVKVSTIFSLYSGLGTLSVLDCSAGVEKGVQVWTEIPAIQIPLKAGVGISTNFGLATGQAVGAILSLEVGTKQEVTCSLASPIVKGVEVPLTAGVGVGINLGLRYGALAGTVVDLIVGTKIQTNLGLAAPAVIVPSANLMAFPVAKVIGVSMSPKAPVPAPEVLSGIIVLKVGASLGLVSNLIQETVVLCNGGTCIDVACLSPDEAQEIFETWVVTGNNFAPSVYSGFPFNSYATYKGKEYACGPDGIFLLEGADDDGQEIHPGMRLVTNFGNEKHKRLRNIHIGKAGDKAKIRVAADNREGGAHDAVFEPDPIDHRAQISRNLQSQQFVLDIIDFSQLSQLEIVILPLVKR